MRTVTPVEHNLSAQQSIRVYRTVRPRRILISHAAIRAHAKASSGGSRPAAIAPAIALSVDSACSRSLVLFVSLSMGPAPGIFARIVTSRGGMAAVLTGCQLSTMLVNVPPPTDEQGKFETRCDRPIDGVTAGTRP